MMCRQCMCAFTGTYSLFFVSRSYYRNTTYGMHVRSHTVLSLVWPTVSLAVQVYRLPHWLSSNHTYSTGRRLLAVAACKKKISVKCEIINWNGVRQRSAVHMPCVYCTVQ